jgi:hypothetical protein
MVRPPPRGSWPEPGPPLDPVPPEVVRAPAAGGSGDGLGVRPGLAPTGGNDGGVGATVGSVGNGSGGGLGEPGATAGSVGNGSGGALGEPTVGAPALGGVVVGRGRAGSVGEGRGDGNGSTKLLVTRKRGPAAASATIDGGAQNPTVAAERANQRKKPRRRILLQFTQRMSLLCDPFLDEGASMSQKHPWKATT